MFRAEDPTRSNVLPVTKYTAILYGQTAVVTGAHDAHLAMNTHLLALEACALSRSEAVVLDSVADASLLVELALHNRISWLFLRCGLSKCQGRGCNECRHKCKFEELHCVSPFVTAVAEK
jgi:hypothetical protein